MQRPITILMADDAASEGPRPDRILLDANLPRMNGVGVLASTRTLPNR